MSDEMAIGDKTSNSERMPDHKESIGDSNDSLDDADSAAAGSIDSSEGGQNPTAGALKKGRKDSLTDEISEKLKAMEKDDTSDIKMDTLENTNEERSNKRRASAAFSDDGDEEFKGFGQDEPIVIPDYNRIVDDVEVAPRRKSTSSDVSEEFKGFEIGDQKNLTGYNQILERLEAELSEDVKSFTPLKTVLTAPLIKASKRARQDTDSSRPSSALSSRSEGEGVTDASMSPANRGRRTDVSSPLLRLPLERGWRRELVYRAALDAHSRRAADIYYYMPSGKKLRSMREISEVLGGTGLTTENFSFFKEPLGIDDPEKEIIRDAKMMRRVESPVPQPPLTTDGKRTPKPKPPKGASPEPTPKSPPAKIKVKSMGSRLSNSGTPTGKPARKAQPIPPPAPAPAPPAPAQPDNNNSAAWKKPRGAPPPLQPRPAPPPPRVSDSAPVPDTEPAPAPLPVPAQAPAPVPVPVPVPVLVPVPVPVPSSAPAPAPRYPVGQRPCSMSCGRGAVPSLACGVCLCLYHPACVGETHVHADFLCKNCSKSTSPPPSPPPPPPLTHKPPAPGPARRVPVPAKVPRTDKRPATKVKAVGGATACAGAAAALGPQSLAIINGRRFIVVARPANT